jgi:hypothetical protein
MLVMAEQVKMSVPEAIDLLSQKIVDLENTVAAQFMVISVLKFHLENSGVISRSQLANTAELFMNPGEPLFKSPEAEAFFVEYLKALTNSDDSNRTKFTVIKGDKDD